MSESAKKIELDPITLDGMAEVFDLEPVTEGTAEPVTCTQEPITGASRSCSGVPVEQAAILLGSSINAVKKRLRKGTLSGFKLETKHGAKWFVDHSEVEPSKALVTDALEPVTEGTAGPVTNAVAHVTHTGEPVTQDLIDRIRDLESKLEGASFRNGYLAAENEGLKAIIGVKDSHIKLLTDSQHNANSWKRFWSWFITRK